MIFGIGCDLCEIDRIAAAGERFAARYFTENEQKLFEQKKKNKPQTVAANFAVKEAFSKALGTGVRGFGLCDVEVLRDELGKPYINLYADAQRICKELGISSVFVSISHTDSLALAYVVLER
ncbi:MAG: holo-ACP synthase [Clostridia bacterium]|nr:holo-ACP synthase [Clostridia bacterium]